MSPPQTIRSPGRALGALLLSAALALFAAPGRAADGVIEINQARALAGGVTPGDAPGFPVTIGVRGSYRLTGDLVVTGADTTAVDVTADDVTLDLGGFGVHGPVTCSGAPLVCAPSGGSRGIQAVSSGGLTVRNGRVRGFGYIGVYLGPRARASDLLVRDNGYDGLYAGADGQIRNVTATRNGGRGIYVERGRIEGAVADFNASNGFGGAYVVIVAGYAEGNGANGVSVAGPSVVLDSVLRDNAFDGIRMSEGTVSRCTIADNDGDGVQIQEGSVRDSTIRNNVGAAIRVDTSGRVGYAGNVLTDNNGGAETQVLVEAGGTATVLGTNLCGTNTTCP